MAKEREEVNNPLRSRAVESQTAKMAFLEVSFVSLASEPYKFATDDLARDNTIDKFLCGVLFRPSIHSPVRVPLPIAVRFPPRRCRP